MSVLMIEDDAELSAEVVVALKREGTDVAVADDGHRGLVLCQEREFSAIIIDLNLPGINGLDLIDRIRGLSISTPILILSARKRIETKVEGLELGADDYLTKPFSMTELVARLKALVRRAGQNNMLVVDDLTVDVAQRAITRGDQDIELQNREFELLVYLMRNKNRVVSKSMIIKDVWKFNFDPQTNIVEARISKLRDKIDRPFDLPLIHTVKGAGYRIGS